MALSAVPGSVPVSLRAATAADAGLLYAWRGEPSVRRHQPLQEASLADLRTALENDELELFYQPIIDIQSDRMHGYEALLRWRHPTRGLVSPIDFIPLAEDTGLIVEIGRRCILEAAKQIQAWTPPGGGKPPQVAVNVSGRQFRDAGFVQRCTRTCLRRMPRLCVSALPRTPRGRSLVSRAVIDRPRLAIIEIYPAARQPGARPGFDDRGTGGRMAPGRPAVSRPTHTPPRRWSISA